MENSVKYRIGADIKFEAAGNAEFVERERKVFFENILPSVAAFLYTPPLDKPAYEEQPPTQRDKTQIGDCRACWCNTCANIEDCVDAEEQQPDTLRPYPCEGCANGVRYMPRQDEEKCPCTGYVQGDENNG